MAYLLLPCILVTLICGVLGGKKLAVALHQGNRRQLLDASLRQAGVTFLTLTYGTLLQPPSLLWPALMLNASVLGLLLGVWLAQRHAGRELSSAQLRTEAILER
ncbi:hypothetical protein Dxin01_02976 [Deinococcus xinjiangensis]|uniref:Uncharacterized protein n=1 Tax=Deinococcus xinjiangensis TaxID=457454 RepID=A0ABP9VDA4_9DEIO